MLKQGDFIEVEYTGKIKEENKIFDTTDEEIAKKEKIYNKSFSYTPVIICLGQNQIIPGLDNGLINKDPKEYEIELSPEKAFGKKNPKLLRLVSSSSFKKENITPFPGLQVNLDGLLGIIRTVTPGRVIIDFNHPLAGKTLVYKVKVLRLVKDTKEKILSLTSFYSKEAKVELTNDEATVKIKDLPDSLEDKLEKDIKQLIPEIKKVTLIKE
jgi:peptidylprolyl isomerase